MARKNAINFEIQNPTLEIFLMQNTYWLKWQLQLHKKKKNVCMCDMFPMKQIEPAWN